MPQKRKLPADKQNKNLVYRAGEVQRRTESDGIRLVLATETPVRVWDYQQRAIVDEVLRMDGIEHPQQVPLLNSHHRERARDVIGSIRDLEVVDGRLEGTAYFASDEEAQSIRRLYDEGHLTDFSVGFTATDVQPIAKGKSASIAGRQYTGPARIVTRAKVKEGSAVPIGADENAKSLPAIRAYAEPEQLAEEFAMKEARDLALRCGMPVDHDGDPQQWIEDNFGKRQPEPEPEPRPEPGRNIEEVEARELERERAAKITAVCDKQSVSRSRCASYIASDLSYEQVCERILTEKNDPPPTPIGSGTLNDIEPRESQTDKMIEGMSGALLQRCLSGINLERAERQARGEYELYGGGWLTTSNRDHEAMDRQEEVKKLLATPFSRDFRSASLIEFARAFCLQAGMRTDTMPRHEVVRNAMRLDLLQQRDITAYHTTGTLANVLLDAANKTLLAAYDEAAVTYPIWTRMAPSAPDYKTLNRIRLGEVPDPSIVTENAPYGESPVSDNKEPYNIHKYGSIFSISLEAIVNDDLNAIARIPQLQGYAMRRKVNKVVYNVLTANEALSDDIALFHGSSHGANLDGNALSAANLNTGFSVMMTQTGVSSDTILNLMPRYLIVPAALSATALQIVNSTADPTTSSGTTEDADRPQYNAGTRNIYGPQGPRRLVPVIDANLDGSSTTAWYLAAETSQIDTVEVTFLQGEESPVLEREMGFEVDAVKYKIRQSFAAKAIDYRGLYQGNS